MSNKEKAVADLRILHTVLVKACGNIPLTIDELAFASKYAAQTLDLIRRVEK